GSTIGPSTNVAPNLDELDLILKLVESFSQKESKITNDINKIKQIYDDISYKVNGIKEAMSELKKKIREISDLRKETHIVILEKLCGGNYSHKFGGLCNDLTNFRSKVNEASSHVDDATKRLAALLRDARCALPKGVEPVDLDIPKKIELGERIREPLSRVDAQDYVKNIDKEIVDLLNESKQLESNLKELLVQIDESVEKRKKTLEKFNEKVMGCKTRVDIGVILDCLNIEEEFKKKIEGKLSEIANDCNLDEAGAEALRKLVDSGYIHVSELLRRGIDPRGLICALDHLNAVIKIE
ncbi:MAG: hypothetical protein ACP5UD_10220, partial [Conexivisphaera sp.]